MSPLTSYIVETVDGTRLTVYEQNAERATKAQLWTPGERVQLNWSPDHTFVIADSPGGGAGAAPPDIEPALPGGV